VVLFILIEYYLVVIIMKKFVFLFIIVFLIICFCSNTSSIGYVDYYYVYGNHLNIGGHINGLNNPSLVFKSETREIVIPIIYDNGDFFVSSVINDGILLDSIPRDNFFVFLKDGNDYYSLVNNTKYSDISYYTISRGFNNIINIGFDDNMFVSSSVGSVYDGYYDIIIDPGHGGNDPGACFGDYCESSITLDLAYKLKDALELLGLKVGMTRYDDVNTSFYGDNSRTSLAYSSHAKFFISIHLNSTEGVMDHGGVEVYAPNNSDLGFASLLANSIVSSSGSSYSINSSYRVMDGVYVRTFGDDDISVSNSTCYNNGFLPYPVDLNTNYYFMIRETGGIMTGAFIDGRSGVKNMFYDSNIGVEAYLLELGYINYSGDLDNILNNSEKYIQGIVNAFSEKLDLKKD